MSTSQGSDAWIKQRLGKVTASIIHKVYSNKPTLTKTNLMNALAMERLTGRRMKNIKTVDMTRGLNTEPYARAAYEEATQRKVSLVGFIPHPSIENAGASPDGFVGDEGLIEIKCLNIRNHNQIIKNKKIPKQYFYQIQFQLACTKKYWGDFVAFNPDADEAIYIERVLPDKAIMDDLHTKINFLLLEIEGIYQHIKKTNAVELHKYL